MTSAANRHQALRGPIQNRRLRTFFAVLAVAALLSGAMSGCGRDPRASGARDRPNILLITICTFRYSHMGAAGYGRNTTPFLDSLAGKGLFFENAASSSSWTKPSVASILTGLTSQVHGMTDFYEPPKPGSDDLKPSRILADEIVTLPEALRDAGYATGAAINNSHISEFFNLVQGFETRNESYRLDTSGLVDRLEAFLAETPSDEPFFFFMLSRDPHVTFNPDYEVFRRFNRAEPLPTAEAYAGFPRDVRQWALGVRKEFKAGRIDVETPGVKSYVDLYDAELAQLDAALRRVPQILEEAGRAENTLIVFTADHGERLFDHGNLGHGAFLDEATVHVPLFFVGPGIAGGQRDPRQVRSIDLYPTLARLAGAELPSLLPGRDLFAPVPDDADPAKLSAPSSVYEREHSVRAEGHVLYQRARGELELFDLEADRGEDRELSATRPGVTGRLKAYLEFWQALEERTAPMVGSGGTRSLTPEIEEELRALGYIQ
ncbi:MAG: hypothetical protein CL910_07120 [Deltaproteobacteria bacterium]|nr:hypothetical protein [Deltaproteobacteria bacterium]